MYKRSLITHLQELAKKYPVVTLLGPRQSGKTTLVRMAFPEMPYVNMEDPESRHLAETDPKSFMETYGEGAIFDEIQRTPHLMSYIQVTTDEKKQNGMFILTGSHQAELHSAVAQSLAGRTPLLRLLPLSLEEMRGAGIKDSIDEVIFRGGYPRVYKEDLPVSNAYSSYFQTYVERDVRSILKIKDVSTFERFVKLLASRVGQLINYSSLALDVGVSSVTIKEWVSVLEATYVLFRLEPYYENFGKRMIKSPKLYFVDTGLVAHLLGIESPEQMKKDKIYGNLFENWVVLELLKMRYNQALDPNLYFYRDVQGKEIDVLMQKGSHLIPIEIKSGKTFSPGYIDYLNYFHSEHPDRAEGGYLIYGGEKRQKLGAFELIACEQLKDPKKVS